MMRRMSIALMVLIAGTAVPVFAQKVETISGYSEWQKGGALIVDGQRVVVDASTRFSGDATARVDMFPLGAEVEVRGARQADGTLLAASIKAKRNSIGLLERSLRDEADEVERKWLHAGGVEDPDDDEAGGRILERGPHAARARRIVDRLIPPYLEPSQFRVYVVDNDDWNAFAMPNGSVWVYTGLMRSLNDDELAIVLGHELAHVTHEHGRRDSKSSLWIGALAAAVNLAAEQIDGKKTRTAVQVVSFAAALAADSAFGRRSEDQADRVGLRYAYEAGFDPSVAPRLWRRFEDRYGAGSRVVNFFLSDHSRSPVRAAHLEQQLAWNYAPGIDRPSLARGADPVADVPVFRVRRRGGR